MAKLISKIRALVSRYMHCGHSLAKLRAVLINLKPDLHKSTWGRQQHRPHRRARATDWYWSNESLWTDSYECKVGNLIWANSGSLFTILWRGLYWLEWPSLIANWFENKNVHTLFISNQTSTERKKSETYVQSFLYFATTILVINDWLFSRPCVRCSLLNSHLYQKVFIDFDVTLSEIFGFLTMFRVGGLCAQFCFLC